VRSLALLLIVILMWLAGLFAFAARIARSTPAPEPEPADAIVALTGPSAQRLAAALKLLEDGKAGRLLISGVNRKVSRSELQAVSKGPRRLFDCCVDMGFSAANTIGNARETAAWARAYGFRRLIVVTADYHMPRAALELRGALPGAAIEPYPVATSELDVRHWWKSGASARRFVLEYCKYLVILTREAILSLGPRERPRPAGPVARRLPVLPPSAAPAGSDAPAASDLAPAAP
jgi:uncharacterized SAM-binding protein YcdF (DUF218 family)